MNESLRRAMLRARLREDDVAAHLRVDPKTVRRWLSGRIPYPSSRTALANLVGVDEADLWPDAEGPLAGRARLEQLAAVYPHRWAIPHNVWTRFFESAEREIGVLAYSALFLAEDKELLYALEDKAHDRVRVRLMLGDPDSPSIALQGNEEGIGDTMAIKICKAIKHYQPLTRTENVEIRLHQKVLYNSIYRADGQVLVNQHVYGMPSAQAPVYWFRGSGGSDMVAAYLDSFERVWDAAKPNP